MRLATSAALVCMAAACLISVKPAWSVPAFARRAGRECQTCHFRPPELNVYGQDFLRRGLRVEPPEEPGDEQPSETKRPLGMPLSLNWAEYLSAIGHHGFVVQSDARAYFDAGSLDLWVAGPISRQWSGLVNPSFDLQNGGSDVDSGYAHYVNPWADRFASVRFGQRLPFAILLNQGGPSLTLSTPLVLSMTADTGNTWTPTSFMRSIEVGGVNLPHWNVYFSAGNPRLDDSQTSQPGFDNNIDINANAEWLFGALDSSITAYGYWGHAWLSPTVPSAPFHRAGAFFNIYAPNTKVVLGYLAGADTSAGGRTLNTSGTFALAEKLIEDEWSAYFRYDWFRQDLDAGGSRRLSGPTFGASYWAATEVWLTMELQFIGSSSPNSIQENTFLTELTWAF